MKKLLRSLFSNRPDNLSKREYWEKWEFFDLMNELHKAEKLLSGYKGGYSSGFLSAEDFHSALVEEIDDIEFGNKTDLSILHLWFAPTCDWDDIVGLEGVELGNKTYSILDNWKKNACN
jgi:hypothetical protein